MRKKKDQNKSVSKTGGGGRRPLIIVFVKILASYATPPPYPTHYGSRAKKRIDNYLALALAKEFGSYHQWRLLLKSCMAVSVGPGD